MSAVNSWEITVDWADVVVEQIDRGLANPEKKAGVTYVLERSNLLVSTAMALSVLWGVLSIKGAEAWELKPVQIASTPNAGRSTEKLFTPDSGDLLAALDKQGYSDPEKKEMEKLMTQSLRFAQKYNLSKPLSVVRLSPISDAPADRLAVVDAKLAKLVSLSSKSIKEATWVDKITPENIIDVLTFVHAADPDEEKAMYDYLKIELEQDPVKKEALRKEYWDKIKAFEQNNAWKGKRWKEKHILRTSPEGLKRACDGANELLANASHLSREMARIIITTVLDWNTPPPADISEEALENRKLNDSQSMAWMAGIVNNGPYRAGPEEIVKVTVDDITYSFWPDKRVSKLPGLPPDKRGLTMYAFNQLKGEQIKWIAAAMTVAATDPEVVQMKKETQQNSEYTRFIVEVGQIHQEMIPLMEQYLFAKDEKTKATLRESIRAKALRIKEIANKNQSLQPLNAELAQIQKTNTETIQKIYSTLSRIKIDWN